MTAAFFRKPRFLFVYPLVVLLFVCAHTTEAGLRWGAIVVLIGEFIRLWADGYVGHVKVNATQRARGDARIGRLITAGPYAFVRHPLYFGTFVIGIGFSLIVGHLWFGVVALACFLLLYRRKMHEEEQWIAGEWPDEYAAYQHRVPQWLPAFKRYHDRSGQWTWQGIAASKEWKTLIWVIVVILAAYLREEIIQEHHWLAPKEAGKELVWLGVMVVLIATDVAIELKKRRTAKRALAHAHP